MKKKSLFDLAIEIIGGITFLAIIALTFAETVSRYCFGISNSWAQELPTFLMVLLGFTGAVSAVKTDSHINITLVVDWLPPKAGKVLLLLGDLACFVFCIVTAWASIGVVQAQSARVASGSHVNMGLVYGILPVAMIVMAILLAIRMKNRIKDLIKKDEKEA